jgi:hypothetical protein
MAPELHVHPTEDGAQWVVEVQNGRAALSAHHTAREAEVAAQHHAADCGARRIYLHDAYHRVHCAAVR